MAFRVSGIVTAADLGFVIEALHKSGKIKSIGYKFVEEEGNGAAAPRPKSDDGRPLSDRIMEIAQRRAPRETTRQIFAEDVGESALLGRALNALVEDNKLHRVKKGTYGVGPAQSNGAATPPDVAHVP